MGTDSGNEKDGNCFASKVDITYEYITIAAVDLVYFVYYFIVFR